MSIQVIAQVLDLEDERLDCSQKAVLIALANHTGPTGQCFPGLKRIMRYTALSERAVRTTLRKLEEHGFIEVQRRKDPANPGLNLTSLYFLTLGGSADAAGVGQEMPQGGAGDAGGVGQDLPPNRNSNHKTNASDARAISDDWQPCVEMQEWADKHYPILDIDHQRRLFIAACQANGTVHRDSDAAFKQWLLRTDTLKTPPKQRTAPTPARPERAPGVDAAAHEAQAHATTNPMEAARLYLLAAQAHEKDGNTDDARRCARQVCQLRPSDDFLHRTAVQVIARCLSPVSDTD